MFINLHALPTGKSMYTLCIADRAERAECPKDFTYDEYDVVAPSQATRDEIVAVAVAEWGGLYDLEGENELVGLIDQSVGMVRWQVTDTPAPM